MPSLDRVIRLDASQLTSGLTGLLQAHPFVQVVGEALGVREQNEIHYDTPNLQLHRHHVSLLIHRRDAQWIQRCTRQEEGAVELQWVETPLAEAQLDLKPLRKLSLFPLLNVDDLRALEVVFTLHCRAQSWRLSFPDGQILLTEEQGYWKFGADRYPFHALLLQWQTGSLARWYQVGMDLAWLLYHGQSRGEEGALPPWERVGPALLGESPVGRAFAALAPQRVLPLPAGTEAPYFFVLRAESGGAAPFFPLSGEMSGQQVFREVAGRLLQALAVGQHAVLFAGKQDKLERIRLLHRDVERLQALLRYYDPFMPRGVAAELENELGWLLKELLLVHECQVLQQVSLEPLLEQFAGHAGLDGLLNKTRNGLLLAIKRLEKSVSSFRFTRLMLGLHNWLQGELWDFLSDPLLREALEAPLQRRAGEWLQESYQRVRRQGRQWQELSFADRSALVTELDQMGHAVMLFGELFANRRGRSGDGRLFYAEALQRMQEALHRLLHIESSQRFLLRGVAGEEAALQAMQAWQAERLQRALQEAGRCWELFANKLSFWS
ncbi:MAG: CHAD domain-containing protein [Magnetococcales bacterium]|nr:CHAD domain-containing protein [Magnetococcales bacterium]MBF0113988.1 CHAD domain-containing protein [Magnetococcales bacterium]